MITLLEFTTLLDYLYDCFEGGELTPDEKELMGDILFKKKLEGEWLNTRFIEEEGMLYSYSCNVNNYILQEGEKKLLDGNSLLTEECIHAMKWAHDPTNQGLPKLKIDSGSMRYLPPKSERSALFLVQGVNDGTKNYDRTLACDKNSGGNKYVGVRPVFIKNE